MAKTIYKIVPASLWQKAKANGIFEGAAIDLGALRLDETFAEAPKVSFDGSAPATAQGTGQPQASPAIESADTYYETPNYGVRSGVQDTQAAHVDPLASGSQFGYQPAPQPVTPPEQAPRQGQYGQQQG